MRYILTESQITNLNKKNESSQKLKDYFKNFNTEEGIKLLGSLENYIDVVFDGDLPKFSKESDMALVKLGEDSLKIHSILVPSLDLPPNSSRIGYQLGKFRTNKSLFDCYLSERSTVSGYHWVIGVSGDYGWGFSLFSKKNTTGKRERHIVFQQIISKYDLEKYIK